MASDQLSQEISSRYLSERCLGEQPAGRFHVAVDTELGGRVTVFFPRLHGADPQAFVERLRPELARCAPLRDTAYCTLRDAGVAGSGEAFVVLERPQGTPLASILRDQERLSVDRALTIAIQLCDLVQRAHALDIHPVPVTPDAIVVELLPGERQRVSLVDLALDRALPGRAPPPSPDARRHLAPQVRDGLPPDVRDDVFAVTAVLHTMVFGVAPPPMSAHGPADGSGWPALPDGGRGIDRRLEACLQTVLLKGLAEAREERFERIGELQRSLTGLRQLMQLSASAFELLAATRGRLGRRTGPVELAAMPEPGLVRARQARARIREVVARAVGGPAHLSELDDRRLDPADVVRAERPRLMVVAR